MKTKKQTKASVPLGQITGTTAPLGQTQGTNGVGQTILTPPPQGTNEMGRLIQWLNEMGNNSSAAKLDPNIQADIKLLINERTKNKQNMLAIKMWLRAIRDKIQQAEHAIADAEQVIERLLK